MTLIVLVHFFMLHFLVSLSGYGSRSTFIYYFDSETWDAEGPEYPDRTSSYGYSVPYKKTFLSGDGEQSDGTVYKYNTTTDDWDVVAIAQTEHYFGTGMLIPDSFYCHCGDEEVHRTMSTCILIPQTKYPFSVPIQVVVANVLCVLSCSRWSHTG